MLEDFRLRTFITVAGCGSFTLAARELGVTQPAVSQNIALLEQAAGTPLFERAHGSVTLTEKGQLFLECAEKIMFWYSKLDDAVAGVAPKSATLLPLGDGRSAEVSVVDGEICIRPL